MNITTKPVGETAALVTFSHGRLLPEVTLKAMAREALTRSPETAGGEWDQPKIWVSMGFTSNLRIVHFTRTKQEVGQ